MPLPIATPWLSIAKSGNTIDDRFIKKEWLEDIAETYDPAEYTALIWLEHDRWNSYGKVLDVKVEEKDGELILFAKLNPSRSLLNLTDVWEQANFFSIEPEENFAKTGKTYLVGLGITDQPASLGTGNIQFSNRAQKRFDKHFSSKEKCPDLRPKQLDDSERVDNFAEKLWNKLFSKEKTNQEDFGMSQEQLDALTQKIEDIAKQVETFAKKEGGAGGEQKQTPADDSAADAATVSPEQFAILLSSVQKLAETQTTLGTRFESIAGKLDKSPAGGTQFSEHTGDDDKQYL